MHRAQLVDKRALQRVDRWNRATDLKVLQRDLIKDTRSDVDNEASSCQRNQAFQSRSTVENRIRQWQARIEHCKINCAHPMAKSSTSIKKHLVLFKLEIALTSSQIAAMSRRFSMITHDNWTIKLNTTEIRLSVNYIADLPTQCAWQPSRWLHFLLKSH